MEKWLRFAPPGPAFVWPQPALGENASDLAWSIRSAFEHTCTLALAHPPTSAVRRESPRRPDVLTRVWATALVNFRHRPP